MKRKIFVPYPQTPNSRFGVFIYDYTPALAKQMPCDKYGFYHSQGEKIILESENIKYTHLVQGWDLGNGNKLSMPDKIIECADYYCKSNQTYYVAYTIPYNIGGEELYAVYLYSILRDCENEELFLDAEKNIFDNYKPQKVFDIGINGSLSFCQTGSAVYLKWLNKSCSGAADLKSYSYNLFDSSIQTDDLDSPESTESHIGKLIAENTASYIHFHKVCDDEDLYVCVIEPVVKKRISPAIVVCLGGPNIPVPDFAAPGSIYERFRQEGFFVVIPLRRGVIGISQEWANGINNNAGTVDIYDILKGVEYAITEYSTEIDVESVGLYGASYGGFSSLLIAGKHNSVNKFKAVVSHCGMSDLESYPYECYGSPSDIMDFYSGNNDFFQKAKQLSPYLFVDKWSVPVLLVHTIDDTSVWFGQSVRTYNKGVELGKNVELILAPGPHSYNIQNGQELVGLVVDFFLNNLTC